MDVFYTSILFLQTICNNDAFMIPSSTRRWTLLHLQTNLELPVLDVMDKDEEMFITPLPSSPLPDSLTTPFLYGLPLDTPLHKAVIDHSTKDASSIYGHLVWKPENSLVGAIGCASEILTPTITKALEDMEDGPNTAVLCRGKFRFVVQEVLQSVPYPVVLVDEIEDDSEDDDSDMFGELQKDEDDDESDIMYPPPDKILAAIMQQIQSVVSNALEKARSQTRSPLEESILQEATGGTIDPVSIEIAQAEEITAVWEVFQTTLVDDMDVHQHRKPLIAYLAASIASLPTEIRQKILITRSSSERLQIVYRAMDEHLRMATARKLATQITDSVDDDSRDLKVGTPTLPPWAKQIQKGSRVEYFWNEEYGWCAGRVVEDPVTIVDEILLTIEFDDGETHQLPLTAEEKVRWRPGD